MRKFNPLCAALWPFFSLNLTTTFFTCVRLFNNRKSKNLHALVSTILLFIFGHTLVPSSSALKITRLSVPKAVENGSSVFLSCSFDLEGEVLYSVKWYRDYVEFFRFLPSNAPHSAQPVILKGAHVDASRSNSSHVLLYRTDLDSEGTYACEVSTESPSYSTVRAEQAMKIYVLPKERVYVDGFTGSQTSLEIGDLVNVTCVSGASKPAPKMAWFINGDMALPDQVIQFPTQTLINGLQTRKLGLLIAATPDLFKRRVIKLRCSATLLLTYQFEATRVITGGGGGSGYTGDSGHFDPSSLDSSGESGHSVQRAKEAPVITGGKTRYKIGDWINLNCSTSADDVHLKWYINGNDAGPLQTREYLYHGPIPGWTLGLRLHMQKMHFQMPELKLKCVAIHHDIIKEYQTAVNVIAKNYELVEAASSSASSGLAFTARPLLVIISTSLSGTLILCSFFAHQRLSSTLSLTTTATFFLICPFILYSCLLSKWSQER